MNYEKRYKEALERMKSWAKGEHPECFSEAQKAAEFIFPELKEKENEDERIRKEIIRIFKGETRYTSKEDADKYIAWLEKQKDYIKLPNSAYTSKKDVIEFADNYSHTVWENLMDKFKKIENFWISCNDVSDIVLNAIINTYNWLEKQGEKSVNIDIESMVSSYEQRLESQGGTKYTPLVNMCLTAFRHGIENTLEELNFKHLEKQGENKHTDKVEPKFKVGDWITNGEYTWKIVEIKPLDYILQSQDGNIVDDTISYADEHFHLWSIQDAMDGDVLTTDNFIFIFKSIDNSNGVHYYCHYEISKHEDDSPRFGIALSQSLMGIVGSSFTHYKPATKEQRDLLFQKMEEEGYEWDAENKKLKTIKPKKLDVWNAEDEQNLNVVLSFIEDECLRRWLKDKLCYDTLDTNKVIAWLAANICNFEYYVKLFKKDFGL